MSRVTLAITGAPNKWLRAIRGPVSLVIKLSSVPESLISELWHADGMRGWASTTRRKPNSCCGIEHVILVIWGVEVLAIPACGEVVLSHNSSRARYFWEVRSLGGSSQLGLKASIAKTIHCLGLRIDSRASNSHAETRLECRDLVFAVCAEIYLCIINSHSTLDVTLELSIIVDWDAMETSVACLEI